MTGAAVQWTTQIWTGRSRASAARLTSLEAERAELVSRLAGLERGRQEARSLSPPRVETAATSATITATSAPAQKIELFRWRFAGRPDVFPVRWENVRTQRSGYAPACANEGVKGVCGKPQGLKCGDCPNQAFIPVSDAAIARHLTAERGTHGEAGGGFVMGVYALLPDETCRFLAVDFDGASWSDDARAFVETSRAEGVPVALERSRSGEGGHVWIFFASPVPARDARRLGAWLVTRTMERRPEIGFASYDRFFPSQDTMPLGGFGNLIALPLQSQARARGNSVFVDDQLCPYQDQWAYLASVPAMDPTDLAARMMDPKVAGGLFGGVRLPVEDENADEPWHMPPSRRRDEAPITGPLPATVRGRPCGPGLRRPLGAASCNDGTPRQAGSVPKSRILPGAGDAAADLRQDAHTSTSLALRPSSPVRLSTLAI